LLRNQSVTYSIWQWTGILCCNGVGFPIFMNFCYFVGTLKLKLFKPFFWATANILFIILKVFVWDVPYMNACVFPSNRKLVGPIRSKSGLCARVAPCDWSRGPSHVGRATWRCPYGAAKAKVSSKICPKAWWMSFHWSSIIMGKFAHRHDGWVFIDHSSWWANLPIGMMDEFSLIIHHDGQICPHDGWVFVFEY